MNYLLPHQLLEHIHEIGLLRHLPLGVRTVPLRAALGTARGAQADKRALRDVKKRLALFIFDLGYHYREDALRKSRCNESSWNQTQN
jgi:hypothetical protein